MIMFAEVGRPIVKGTWYWKQSK